MKDKYNIISELAWLLVWISLYGIVDYYIKTYLRLDQRVIVFLLLGIIGLFIIFLIDFQKRRYNIK
jgi:membrane protein YdbS with pleckstrin-like domain